jgi:hypothetical protein
MAMSVLAVPACWAAACPANAAARIIAQGKTRYERLEFGMVSSLFG